mgnify:CR=1 FL=1|jgi:hypothetical protein
MREKIKCLDGPLEGTEIQLDRRLMRLYDETVVTDEDGSRHQYMIFQNGLKWVKQLT